MFCFGFVVVVVNCWFCCLLLFFFGGWVFIGCLLACSLAVCWEGGWDCLPTW